MAYGQTGTGKTFTLGRLGEEDCADRGIMVRAMEDILANINPGEDTVTVSYLQVAPCSLFLLVTMATNTVLPELQDFSVMPQGIEVLVKQVVLIIIGFSCCLVSICKS